MGYLRSQRCSDVLSPACSIAQKCYLLSPAGPFQQQEIQWNRHHQIHLHLSLMQLHESNLRGSIKLLGILCRHLSFLVIYINTRYKAYCCFILIFCFTLQILDKEAVEEVKAQREMPDIKPGYIVQLKVVSTLVFAEGIMSCFCHCR